MYNGRRRIRSIGLVRLCTITDADWRKRRKKKKKRRRRRRRRKWRVEDDVKAATSCRKKLKEGEGLSVRTVGQHHGCYS